MKQELTPYLFLSNLNNELDNPYPLWVALVLAYKFKGDIYTNGDNVVTIIDGRCYNSWIEIDMVDFSEYSRFDKLSLLTVAEIYDSMKWFIIDQGENYDEEDLN